MTEAQNTATLAPDVGVIVEYGLDGFGKEPAHYRVDAWMRAAPAPKIASRDFLGKLLFESCREFKDAADGENKRLQFCLREEATHLALAGVAGAIAPIAHCKVVGKVDWSEEQLSPVRQHARDLGAAHEMLF